MTDSSSESDSGPTYTETFVRTMEHSWNNDGLYGKILVVLIIVGSIAFVLQLASMVAGRL
jgi:hypothetical protein